MTANALHATQAVSAADRPAASTTGQTSHIRLNYLDGLRGLAALYVLLYHTWSGQHSAGVTLGLKGVLSNWILYGHLAVDVFIVLSGFCLMLPVARHGSLEGGTRGFLLRRAWRILPTFWAALILSFILDMFIRRLHPSIEFTLNGKTFLGNALLLTENIRGMNGINGVFWSVAVEWKIYFLFPPMVLLWRRWGVPASLGLTALIGYGVFGLLQWLYPGALFHQPGADAAVGVLCPWYVFLFGLGFSAAALAYGPQPVKVFGPKWIALGLTCVACIAALIHASPSGQKGYETNWPWLDAPMGVLTALILLMLAAQSREGNWTRLHTALSWRPLVSLGSFSYSLYLMHIPLLLICVGLFHMAVQHGVPMHAAEYCLFVFGLSAIIAGAYGFSLVFERPFLDSGRRTRVLSRFFGDAS